MVDHIGHQQSQLLASGSARMRTGAAPEVGEVPLPWFAQGRRDVPSNGWAASSSSPNGWRKPSTRGGDSVVFQEADRPSSCNGCPAHVRRDVEAWAASSSSSFTGWRNPSTRGVGEPERSSASSIGCRNPRGGDSVVSREADRFGYTAAPPLMHPNQNARDAEAPATSHESSNGLSRHSPMGDTAAWIGVPAEPSGEQDELHQLGLCKPCVFAYMGKCKKEDLCNFCHSSHSSEAFAQVPASRETRKAMRRRMNASITLSL